MQAASAFRLELSNFDVLGKKFFCTSFSLLDRFKEAAEMELVC